MIGEWGNVPLLPTKAWEYAYAPVDTVRFGKSLTAQNIWGFVLTLAKWKLVTKINFVSETIAIKGLFSDSNNHFYGMNDKQYLKKKNIFPKFYAEMITV